MSARTVFAGAVALTASLAMLPSCGDDDGATETDTASATTAVRDGLGNEVVVPASPQRVFGMYTTDLDYALALEMSVAPTQAIRSGSVGLPDFFPQDEIAGLDFFVNYPEPNLEAIAAAEPDLIINGLGYDGGPDVEPLQAIAPTYTFDGFGGDWRDDLRALAAAFGREEQAAAFLARIEQRTAEVHDRIADRPVPPVLAWGYYNGDGSGGFSGPQPDSLPGLVFADLGIETTAAAPEIWNEVAQEQIGQLADTDLLLIAVETDTDQDQVLARVRADPVWGSLPAVRDGRLVAVNNELSYASPSAHVAMLDVLDEALALLD